MYMDISQTKHDVSPSCVNQLNEKGFIFVLKYHDTLHV